MSEIENSTTDIDNNVQKMPKETPKKRLSRAEKALLESEQLLKSYGVTMESGRQTRSSRRGTTSVIETPKSEPPKRKQPSTPRTSKKTKKSIDFDQTDSTNHVDEGNNTESKIAESTASTAANPVPEKDGQNDAKEKSKISAAPEPVSNNRNSVEKMEIGTPNENPKSDVRTQPQMEVIVQSPNSEQPSGEDEPPIEEDSLPLVIEDSAPSPPTTAVEIIEVDGVSAAADTTTAIVIDSEPIISSPPSENNNKDDDEPIDLQILSDNDQNDDVVSNSQAKLVDIVDLESSSNEGDAIPQRSNNAQEASSLDLEAINSDSSLGMTEIQDDQTSNIDAAVSEHPLSTSAANVTITKITNETSVVKTNDVAENLVHSSEPTHNFRTTITVENPMEETITTTSDTLLKPNATTA